MVHPVVCAFHSQWSLVVIKKTSITRILDYYLVASALKKPRPESTPAYKSVDMATNVHPKRVHRALHRRRPRVRLGLKYELSYAGLTAVAAQVADIEKRAMLAMGRLGPALHGESPDFKQISKDIELVISARSKLELSHLMHSQRKPGPPRGTAGATFRPSETFRSVTGPGQTEKVDRATFESQCLLCRGPNARSGIQTTFFP